MLELGERREEKEMIERRRGIERGEQKKILDLDDGTWRASRIKVSVKDGKFIKSSISSLSLSRSSWFKKCLKKHGLNYLF